MIDIKDFFDKSRQQVFVCIGTMLNGADSIAPRIGGELKKLGYIVHGTPEEQWHGLSIPLLRNALDAYDKSKYQIIAIDAGYIGCKNTKYILKNSYGCSPGRFVNKTIEPIGECAILVNSPALISDNNLDLQIYFRNNEISEVIDKEIEPQLEKLKKYMVDEIQKGLKDEEHSNETIEATSSDM